MTEPAANPRKSKKKSHTKTQVGPPDDISVLKTFQPRERLRFVTATALFDGHDASINIFRRLLQARGAEVIHLGHNRSAQEVADAAIQEDVQGVAVSSYQGGHLEFFAYVRQLLDEQGAAHVRLFGGGGGVISLDEIKKLQQTGTERIYTPEDGFRLGLDGIIGDMLKRSDFAFRDWGSCKKGSNLFLARALSLLENSALSPRQVVAGLGGQTNQKIPVLGITGTGGAGKSSLLDELLLRFLYDFKDIKIGVICVDPSKRKTGGALLGDRIRINSCTDDRVFLRSFASRQSGSELASVTQDALNVLRAQDFDLIVVETSGIGQGDAKILGLADVSLYVMTPEFGAQTQLEKIEMLDSADFVAINKFERRQGLDAIRDVRTLMRRNRFKGQARADADYPVFGTIANRFADDGVNGLYRALVQNLGGRSDHFAQQLDRHRTYSITSSNRHSLLPSERESYLGEIAKAVRTYHEHVKEQVAAVKDAEALQISLSLLPQTAPAELRQQLETMASQLNQRIPAPLRTDLAGWNELSDAYSAATFTYQVRGKDVVASSLFKTLSHLDLPRVALPRFSSNAEIARFLLLENRPGSFPYTGGLFPFRRRGEDPKRQFAGEGGPGRTNSRFHFLCKEDSAKRLSTAFDSVTLYGSEPHKRPDIYGKVGESGVSVAHLDDMKELYKGFDLCSPGTSVSMTINGPAPMILAMFFNTAWDQQVERFEQEKKRSASESEKKELLAFTLQQVRGTVQADILKEDQAQNTCIFSTEFALKMMGDVQEYFSQNKIRNYYAVSISGYHIAEAGANPITQLAFTLANGFTYVEYYLGRGLKINEFAPNLSFFFSNGIDAEYAVLGRVARRIWAIAMRDVYGADESAQKLKYHVQTSGRSLHAQEMGFNDIRTTLQALLALYDNCNSLHTNAFDEAVTTPTEESVRRAMAIQMIINQEFGPNKCENINQGSYFIEMLTDLVEEAVLKEFQRISDRGGVLGAMETQYQRSQIQEESMYYEHLKHSGELPLIGVNTYVNPTAGERQETNLVRASYDEKDAQLERLRAFKDKNREHSASALQRLADAVNANANVFAELMSAVRYCSLGEISQMLYQVGGKYRRAV